MSKKARTRLNKETNPTAYNKTRRNQLRCSICPPNRGENAKRRPKHGTRKPKSKNKRAARKYKRVDPKLFVDTAEYATKTFKRLLAGNRSARLGLTVDEVEHLAVIARFKAAESHKKSRGANVTTLTNVCLSNAAKTLIRRAYLDKYTFIDYQPDYGHNSGETDGRTPEFYMELQEEVDNILGVRKT